MARIGTRTLAFSCTVALFGLVAPTLGYAQVPGARASRCERLGKMLTDDTRLDKAEYFAAGEIPAPFPGLPGMKVPAHCVLRATISPRKGVGGQQFGIGFELRLPLDWSGRFLFQGGGGLDGSIRPAVGMNFFGPTALARGFAVVSTDAGHQGMDATFASDQQARIDYAYAALGRVTEQAKTLVKAFYGEKIRYSYFDGCSNGGRQGMMAASRYPELFDGIVAGDPGFRLSRAAVAEAWNTKYFGRVSQRNAAGRPILSTAFSQAELSLISTSILKQCDAKDGLADGSVNNWRGCGFRIEALQCRPGLKSCLSKAKVTALRAVFDGPRDSSGRRIYAGLPWDPGIAAPGWRSWMIGTAPTAPGNSANETLGADALARYFSTPPFAGSFDPAKFDFDLAEARVAETGAINDATGTFLTSFADRGGKLLIYHGLADPVFSAIDTVGWFNQLQQTMGDTGDWSRLFLVPGMNHCAMGPATDRFDALQAVQAWVEQGKAPDRIIASGAITPGMPVKRPLCPYPRFAQYIGGPASEAENFVCKVGTE